jgi:alkylation response protein AidB-like acyl-CoA dehydrogenase
MNLNLTDDQKLIKDMVSNFSDKELAPTAAHRDETGEFPMPIFRQMAKLGLMGMGVPEQYGGSDTGAVAYALAMMEVARGDGSVGVTMSVTNMIAEIIYKLGTDEQKAKFIPPITQGEYPLGCFALTESGSGSDAGRLTTKAVRDGDDYVITGNKIFISHGAYSAVAIVMARSENIPGPKGISAFIVPKDTPGMSVGKEEHKMGLRGSNTVELVFDNCRVPTSQMLGRPGDGFNVAMLALDSGRIGVACQAIGIATAALNFAKDYAKQREQFGKPIAALQAIQFKLADMATELEAARLLALQAAWLKQEGMRFAKQASMAKLFASEAANRITSQAIQIHGGYGYIKEYPVERLFRDAKVTTIYEGTSEIQRIVIARNVLQE